MDFRDSPREADFRSRLRRWLSSNVPRSAVPEEDGERFHFLQEWHRRLYEGGFIGLAWPAEYGGQGQSEVHEAILNEELGAAGAPTAPHIGFLGRAILLFGSEEQKRRYLPGLLSGDEVWCQGFSEPDAGSDLASLRTSATPEDGQWVINGQKVWTSDAQYADFCLLLARSDRDAPRHRGISGLIVPMRAPGIKVVPLVQISGSREFCEMYFDDVRVPGDSVVGAPGDGWRIAMATVAFERGPVDIGFSSRYQREVAALEARFRDGGFADPESARRRLARAYAAVEVLRVHVLRSLSRRGRGDVPGWESSVDKLLMTRVEQDLHHTVMDVHAPEPLLGAAPEVLHNYFFSRSQSITGGTSEIQKNIVARRGLGLPAD
jgi:alkylation response protein AidB-like acyl-CoA dehydrogenase